MAPHRTHARAQRGFTLIEMAIAVAIFGTLASGAILATSAWLGKQALDKTHKNLDRIESALTLYVVQNGRLPCPYNPAAAAGTYVDTDGTAGTGCNVTGAADVYVGLVPYRDLGLQRGDVLDGWNRYITYAVDGAWTGNPADLPGGPFRDGSNLRRLEQLPSATTPPGGTTGADAVIDVRDEQSEATPVCKEATDPAGTRTATCAAYVLVSHGEAGRGGYANFGALGPAPAANTAEARNTKWAVGTVLIESTPHDITFAFEPFTNDNSPFDHIVRFRTPAQILRDAW